MSTTRLRSVLAHLAVATVTTGMLASLTMSTSSSEDDEASTSQRPHRDREVVRMLRAVDADNMRRIVDELAGFGTRHTLSAQHDPDRGVGAAADWLTEEFEQIAETAEARMTVEQQTFTQQPTDRVPEPTEITNVVATLHGTDPAAANRMYVIGGHYDSRCTDVMDAECDAPGANDDASGVAGAVEAARVLAPYEHDATIVFAGFSGEEQGLLGAYHFAENAVEQGYDIQGVLNNDMIGNTVGGNGRSDDGTIRVFSEGVPSDETEEEADTRRSVGGEMDGRSRQLSRFIAEVGQIYTPDLNVWEIARRDRFGRGGDQTPFLEEGFPAVRLTEPHENYEQQHQDVREEDGMIYGDLPRFVDEQYMARVNELNVATLVTLARAPSTPDNVGLVTNAEDAYSTTLQWEANPPADGAGYEVVWRDTMATRWTNSERVADATSHTVQDVSKDNYMFGVRAVDVDGNRSPVAYPEPQRARQ